MSYSPLFKSVLSYLILSPIMTWKSVCALHWPLVIQSVAKIVFPACSEPHDYTTFCRWVYTIFYLGTLTGSHSHLRARKASLFGKYNSWGLSNVPNPSCDTRAQMSIKCTILVPASLSPVILSCLSAWHK